MKPYTRAQAFRRVASFWSWCVDRGYINGPNRYSRYIEDNARLFDQKVVYKRKRIGTAFDEAKARIEQMANPGFRKLALELLGSGARYTEFVTREGNQVHGKGDKQRTVFVPAVEGPAMEKSYDSFRRALKAATGLTPHNLRALAATRLAEGGLNEFDLCKVFGWDDINTAKYYVQPRRDAELEAQVRQLLQGGSDHDGNDDDGTRGAA